MYFFHIGLKLVINSLNPSNYGLTLLAFVLFVSPVMSEIIWVEEGQDRIKINSGVEYTFDDSMSLTQDEVSQMDKWERIGSGDVNFGFRHQALWLRFSIQVLSSGEYVLHVPYPLIDHLDNYSFINGKALPVIETGDAHDFDSRESDYIDFVFPYTLHKGDVLNVYLRAQSNGALDVPIELLRSELFLEEEKSNTFFRGFVSGILWLMLFYNIFIFIAIKDRVYLFYVIHIFSCMVTSYAYDGTAFQHVWPNMPQLNDYVFPIFNGLIQVTSIIFMMELLQIWKAASWYRTYFIGLLGVVSFFPILGAILPYSLIVPIEVVSSLIVNLSSLLIGLHLSMKGDKSAQYFTVAVSLFMLGLVSSNLKSLGLLPNNFFTQHAYQLGFFIEMVVFSLALAQKIDAAKKELIQVQKESITNLNNYKRLYSDSVSGNFQLETSGKIVSVNGAFCKILGYESESELLKVPIANNITSISVDPDTPKRLMRLLKENGEVVDFEDEVNHSSGKTVWVSVSMRPVLDDQNRITYLEGSMIDITGRKESEYLKAQAEHEKMKSLEQLIVGICHEINTPLGVAITSLTHVHDLEKVLTDSFESKQLTRAIFQDILNEEKDTIEITEDSLVRIRNLLKQFKEISVSQLDYQLSEAPLIGSIQEGVGLSEKAISDQNIQVTISCSSELNLCTYHKAIKEVIHQLVSNSIDHGFSDQDHKVIDISVNHTENSIELLYKDNGCGLSGKGAEELFNPFYTTMRGCQGKIGLGMYVTYNIVTQLLKGEIKVASSNEGLSLIILFSY